MVGKVLGSLSGHLPGPHLVQTHAELLKNNCLIFYLLLSSDTFFYQHITQLPQAKESRLLLRKLEEVHALLSQRIFSEEICKLVRKTPSFRLFPNPLLVACCIPTGGFLILLFLFVLTDSSLLTVSVLKTYWGLFHFFNLIPPLSFCIKKGVVVGSKIALKFSLWLGFLKIEVLNNSSGLKSWISPQQT